MKDTYEQLAGEWVRVTPEMVRGFIVQSIKEISEYVGVRDELDRRLRACRYEPDDGECEGILECIEDEHAKYLDMRFLKAKLPKLQYAVKKWERDTCTPDYVDLEEGEHLQLLLQLKTIRKWLKSVLR